MRHVYTKTQCECQQSFRGALASSELHCSLELCVLCVCLCAWRGWECTFWPGYVCRRAIRPSAQNQSAEPAGSGQICNLCVRVLIYTDGSCAVVAHIEARAHAQWVKHIMHMMQTNKQESRFYFSVSLCNPTLLLPRTHTYSAQKQVGYSYFRLFQREMCIKADLRLPDSGLMCQHSAVFRDSNALTPKGWKRTEGEHYKC